MDLTELYAKPKKVSFLHSRYYVEGCLLGACACPEIPLPNIWLPWVIKHHNQIQNAAQADAITDVLFEYFKYCLAQMNTNSLKVPEYAVYQASPSSEDPLRQWCAGILMAHSAREQFWHGAWRKMQKKDPIEAPKMAKDLKHCLMMFTTFADPDAAIQEAKSKDANATSNLAEKLPLIANSLGETLHTYVNLSGKLASYLPNQFETFKQD